MPVEDTVVLDLAWPCAICGSSSIARPKHEVAISRFQLNALPKTVGTFQRHLCEFCAHGLDDYLMACVDRSAEVRGLLDGTLVRLGWVSCEDRLPEKEANFLVVATSAKGREILMCTFRPGKGWFHLSDSIFALFMEWQATGITHWAPSYPLPEGI